MLRCVAPGLALISTLAFAQVTTVGDVIVVPDTTGSIHQRVMGFGLPGLTPAQGLACQDAARAALGALADEYDFLVVFLSEQVTGAGNVPLFQQARVTAQNIGQNPLLNDGAPFGSRATLKGCVFMGSARRLPADPDALVGDLGSGNQGLTAMEVLGHELGHLWLVGVDYDQGFGRQEDLRSGDRHYQVRVDSRSVMFGSCIDALGGGVFRVKGCARKYNSMDQYFMGLLPAADVQPLMLVTGQGSNDPLTSLAPSAAPVTIMGSERLVGVGDVVRQMGARSPAFPATQRCFRTGFVYVARATPSPDALLQVDAYRRRFEAWFSFATDGRGVVDTRAVGAGCVTPQVDAGVAVEVDAGLEVDGGVDGGVEVDAGSPSPTGGGGASPELVGNRQLRQSGCGCAQVEATPLLLLLGWLISARRRS